MTSVAPVNEAQSQIEPSSAPKVPGPLFKEIYGGLIDLEDPAQWEQMIGNQTRSFFANTTDISTLEQFTIIHRIPEKLGTTYHHSAYLKTLDSLLT